MSATLQYLGNNVAHNAFHTVMGLLVYQDLWLQQNAVPAECPFELLTEDDQRAAREGYRVTLDGLSKKWGRGELTFYYHYSLWRILPKGEVPTTLAVLS